MSILANKVRLLDLLPHKNLIQNKFGYEIPIAVNYLCENQDNFLTIIEKGDIPYRSTTTLSDHLNILNITEWACVWIKPDLLDKRNELIKHN